MCKRKEKTKVPKVSRHRPCVSCCKGVMNVQNGKFCKRKDDFEPKRVSRDSGCCCTKTTGLAPHDLVVGYLSKTTESHTPSPRNSKVLKSCVLLVVLPSIIPGLKWTFINT
ncbi:hypothetical protein FRX31_027953 [Thalictrum thalictroides]|uniref:Uncharacterized protein n=1 Tax=Thalictrum thalictroides TaxID=46969 RepID=A0A7J6VBJ6_THATH|nr:hypothetical protein FRX31_027953 [Thalictrum thalictroides]